ncbi:MAG TPA: hypothetical protein VEW06_06390 [Xanthobacteraceae bacterium]|nr:hypothetical protein [Xanthobacteraceae bacterium]
MADEPFATQYQPTQPPPRRARRGNQSWLLLGALALGLIGFSLARNDSPAVSTPSTPTGKIDTRLAASEEATFAKVVRENGYICGHVITSQRWLDGTGLSLTCDKWTYDFHQKAGRWALTARKGWGQ